jgi:hypothetical protein
MPVKNAPDSASPRTTSAPSVPAAASGASEVKATEGLPATADAARALRNGAQLFQKGQDKDGNPAAVWMTRKEGDVVEVAITRGNGANATQTTYLLDLKQPDARAAYEDLTRFRTMRADMMGEKPKKTGVQVKAKGSAKKVNDPATGAKGYQGNGTVDITRGDAKATITASGKRVTSSVQGKDGSKTEGKTLEGSAGVAVETKGPGAQVKAGAEVKRSQTTRTEENAAGQKTETRSTLTQAGADAKVVHTSGENTTTATADIDWSLTQTDFIGPDGQLTRKEERSHSINAAAAHSDTTGPDQHTVSAKFVDQSNPTSKSRELGVDAKGQRTAGEQVIQASGSFNTKNSHTAAVDQTATSGAAAATVTDKTGDVQHTTSGKLNVTHGTKVETDAAGRKTTTDDRSLTAAASTDVTVKTGKDSSVSAGATIEAGRTEQRVQGPGGESWNRTETGAQTGQVTVKDGGTTVGGKIARKETETSTGDGAGLRQQKGTLGQEIDLTASFQGNRKVGFERDTARDYVFALPASSTGTPALPLDHRAALALPEGATFALTAKGKIGIQGEADGFKGGISQERQVEVKIERKGGSVVAASVNLGERKASDLAFKGEAGDAKGLHGTFSASHKGNRADARQDKFQLDLAVPEHQAAYDALLRGNLAPAQAIAARAAADGTGLSTQSSVRGNEQAAKLGIAFGPLGASAELFRKDLDPADPAIQKDPTRSALSAAAQKEGRELRWIERGGAVEVGGGYSGGVAPGAAGFSFGFEGRGALEWRSIGPRSGGEGGAPGVVMRAEEALAMPPGSEFSLRGQAKISGRVGAIGGWHTSAGPVQVNAGVTFEASKSKVMDLGVRVKSLGEGKVEVRMDELDQSRRGLQLAARLGADIDAAQLAASGGSVLAALAKRPDAAAKLAEAKKYLSAEFKLGTQWSREEGKGVVFTLDLQKPEARAAYEQLVRGNAEDALDLAARSSSGVALQAHSQLVSEGKQKEVSLRVGGADLYVNKQSRTDGTVEVTTRGETERLDRTTGAREKSSIFGRRRALEFDAVSLRTPRAPQGERFMRLSYQEKDKYTSAGELRDRRALAASLGAVPVRPEVVGEDKGGGILRVLSGAKNDHGKVQTSIEVYLTSAGIQQIRGAGREAWLGAYGDTIQQMHGRSPAWNDPDRGARARDLLEQYRRAEGVVDRIERDRPFGNSNSWENRDHENKRWDAIEERDSFRKAYEREFGKDQFKKDVKDFARASEFADAMERASDEVDPAAWNRSFGDLAETMGFNIFDTVAAMNRLAGPDEMVVGKFTMKGKVVDIEMQSEGVVAAPKLSGEAPQTLDQARKAAQSQ